MPSGRCATCNGAGGAGPPEGGEHTFGVTLAPQLLSEVSCVHPSWVPRSRHARGYRAVHGFSVLTGPDGYRGDLRRARCRAPTPAIGRCPDIRLRPGRPAAVHLGPTPR